MAITSTAEPVSSNQDDDRTILPTHTQLSQVTESSVLANSNAPPSSKTSLVAEQKLGDFFPSPAHSAAPKTIYSDASLQQIANLLRLSHRERWSAVPRIYTVLRNIEQLHLIDEFIDEGFTDIWFPFTTRNLPPRLSPSIKAQFLNTQSVVFTQALDLEKGEGRHATFAADEPLWFESRGKLGRGAFGVVDKVVSLITLQEYARKRMRRGNNFTKSKREIKEFKAELAILKTVNHQHCVKLVGSYTDPLYLGLIMDPVADCDLNTFLAEALTDTDKKSLLRGYFGCLASALRYLHERQIRHRDIKPPNILVKGDNVYLADFGIALDWSEMTRGTTTADTAKSPIYCAPEVARSEPRGTSADIWSLGCVFAEMVSVLKGFSLEDMRSYFKKTSGSYMFHHNVETCSQWLSDLKGASTTDNPPIEWSLKMLVFDRGERYTADQLLEVIQLESEHDPSKFVNQSFCGDCCMDEEHISSDGDNVGEDPWADSEDEETLRAHGALASELTLEQGQILSATVKPEGEGHNSSSEAVPEVAPQFDSESKQSQAEKTQIPLIQLLLHRDLDRIDKEQGATITGVEANSHDLNRSSSITPDQESKRLKSMPPVPPKHRKTETFQFLNGSSPLEIAPQQQQVASAERAKEGSTNPTPDSLMKKKPYQIVGGDTLALPEETKNIDLSSEGEAERPPAIVDKLGFGKAPIANGTEGPTFTSIGSAIPDPVFDNEYTSPRSSRSSNALPSSPNLHITIIAADGLYKRDVFRFPDPFATVDVNGEQIKTTAVIKRTLNPYWNESFDLRVTKNSIIRVQVFDQKKFKRKDQGFLGVINLRVPPLFSKREEMITRDLKKSNDNRVVKGKLILCLNTDLSIILSGTAMDRSTTIKNISSPDEDNRIPSMISPRLDENEPVAGMRTRYGYGHFEDLEGKPLPAGWERREDNLGRTYYANHNKKETSWSMP